MNIFVITPSYNQCDWLRICVESVRLQAGKGIFVHHHVQDACSSDGTSEWLAEYAAQNPPTVNYQLTFASEADEGMYDAINKGWLLAPDDVDIVAHLNCDEQYLPGAFEKVAAFFLKHPGVDVAMANIIVVDERGEYVCQRRPWPPWPIYTRIEIPGFTCTTFQRRSVVFEKQVLFDTKWKALGDKQWFIDLKTAGVRFGLLNCYTSAYTYSPGNLNLSEHGRREKEVFNNTLSPLLRLLKPLIIKHNRLRFLLLMMRGERIKSYCILDKRSGKLVAHQISKPKWLWRAYHNLETGEVDNEK